MENPNSHPFRRIPWLGIAILVLALALFGTVAYLVYGQLPPVGTIITFPPNIEPAQLNATLATLRTACEAACGRLAFVNYGLVEVDDVPSVLPGTTYPACICRDRDDTLIRITLRVTRP